MQNGWLDIGRFGVSPQSLISDVGGGQTRESDVGAQLRDVVLRFGVSFGHQGKNPKEMRLFEA